MEASPQDIFLKVDDAGASGIAGDLPPVSVVVVSRHRSGDLALCLAALALQTHPAMEVVLVADPASLEVQPDLRLKRVACDEANISVARNLGIAAAAAAVVAFIDDDAVAEPTWAGRLAAVFADPSVIAAGGYTRGPYGRRWQMRAEAITPDGPAPLAAPPDSDPYQPPRLYRPADGPTLGLLGTNCAFRRSALRAVGGFDPAFPYHLDESDLVLRLAARFPQAATALVPLAEVTHGTAPSQRRGPTRVPRDLRQVGRSEAIFAARHGGNPALIVPRIRARLAAHVEGGRLDPFAGLALLDSLRRGIADAGSRAPDFAGMRVDSGGPPAGDAAGGFLPLRAVATGAVPPQVSRLLTGPLHRRPALRREAARLVADEGAIVTILVLYPSLVPHRTRFSPGGWWEQIGGLWGPSQPGDPPVLALTSATRVQREESFLQRVRNPGQCHTVA